MAVLLACPGARAQTTAAPASAAVNDTWSFSASAATYILSDSHYVQPTAVADRGHLHLEARYNYEDLETGSAWVGVNWSGGETLEWEVTPMLGGVFGGTTGIAPGFKGSLGWRALELYGESEYVVDTNDHADSFFYNWSELTLAPADWFRFGLVTQRTRVYQSDREIQRGLLLGFSVKRVNVTGYAFNPDEDKPRWVFAVEWTF
jgi:hypothetical protein